VVCRGRWAEELGERRRRKVLHQSCVRDSGQCGAPLVGGAPPPPTTSTPDLLHRWLDLAEERLDWPGEGSVWSGRSQFGWPGSFPLTCGTPAHSSSSSCSPQVRCGYGRRWPWQDGPAVVGTSVVSPARPGLCLPSTDAAAPSHVLALPHLRADPPQGRPGAATEPTAGAWGRGCGRRHRPGVELPAAADAVIFCQRGERIWVGIMVELVVGP
jgi:hypothetical protein